MCRAFLVGSFKFLKLLILLSAELLRKKKQKKNSKKKYSLVCFDIVHRSLWKAEHPANNPAAVQAPTQVAHLSPSPSMLHFHHALRDQGFPLGGHEDGAEADLFDLYLAVTLEEEAPRQPSHTLLRWTCECVSCLPGGGRDGGTWGSPVGVCCRSNHILRAHGRARGPSTEVQG